MLNPWSLAERSEAERQAHGVSHPFLLCQLEARHLSYLFDAEIIEGRLRVIVFSNMLGPTASVLFATAACTAALYAVYILAVTSGCRRGTSGGGNGAESSRLPRRLLQLLSLGLVVLVLLWLYLPVVAMLAADALDDLADAHGRCQRYLH